MLTCIIKILQEKIMKNLKNYTIVYAEDETIIRLNVTQMLENYFKEVIAVSDGDEALKLYKANKADALLLDISMPNMSGIEVAQKIRETDDNTPIVLLTALSDRATLLDAVELQLVKYLVKPLTQEEFENVMSSFSRVLKKSDISHFRLSDNYTWNKKSRELFCNEKSIALTPRETSLLELVINHYNEIVSYETIMVYVWADEFEREITIDSVKRLVSSLRKKIPDNQLKNIYGKGYIIK